MTSLKCLNSGVESNRAAFILSQSGHEFASLALSGRRGFRPLSALPVVARKSNDDRQSVSSQARARSASVILRLLYLNACSSKYRNK